jgi:signal transduction histidine kinase
LAQITFKKDIGRKLLLFSILPSLVLSLSLLFILVSEKEDALEKKHAQMLHNIDYRLKTFYSDIEKVAQRVKHSSNVENSMKNILLYIDAITSVVYIDKSGKVIASKSKNKMLLTNGKDYSNQKIYKWYMNKKKSFLSNVYISATTKEPLIAYVFEDNEENIFIFEISLEFFNNYIGSLVGNDKSLRLCIVDQNGICLINSLNLNSVKKSESFYDKKPAYNAVKNNEPYTLIKFYSPILKTDVRLTYTYQEDTNWILVVKDEYDVIYSSLINIIVWIIIFFIIIVLISLISSKRLSNYIIEPVEYLIEEIEKFVDGNNKHDDIKFDTKYKIFSSLVKSFNKMKKSLILREAELKELNENLEKKVTQKTIALQDLNKNLAKRVRNEVDANKEKEKILFEQSKMASMGEMIGNIAHQWRQPLSIVSTVASGIKFQHEMGMMDEKKVIDGMDKIVDTTQYLSTTIDDFRNFFKDDKKKSKFSIQSVIYKNLSLLESAFKQANIEIKSELVDVELCGFQNELVQGVMNILNNAKDAFIENNIEHKRIILINSEVIEDQMLLTICDNAGGIPPQIVSKVFEPYFTTKHQSQGTGIGLYMTREIIVNHMEGRIFVENENFEIDGEKYTGAKFVIQIPMDICTKGEEA